jgi:RimJ/RimL family protein N-acetyltransferase
MEQLLAPLTRAESDAFADRIEAGFEQRGWGLWAVEIVDPGNTAEFAGYVGFAPADFDADFTPAVEIGWRLAAAHWNRGYATEAAWAVAAHGFDRLGFDEIVSFTAITNAVAAMEKVGMTRDPRKTSSTPTCRRDTLRPTSSTGYRAENACPIALLAMSDASIWRACPCTSAWRARRTAARPWTPGASRRTSSAPRATVTTAGS